MNLVDYSLSLWSIVPALLALILAIFTRKVILSLSIGIIVGALMLNSWNLIDSVNYLTDKMISLIYQGEGGLNANNVNIILFLLLLGVLTALLSVSGSNQAFATWAQQHIKGRRGAKLMTFCLVFITFIDDYFHSLAVGAIARPVTDKCHVSRAKLAYILDSTAAPMCVLMPISSWGAYIITLIAGLLATHSLTSQYSPLGAFMAMSAMNFYAVFSMILVFVVAYFSFNIGSMVRFEQEALTKQHEKTEQISDDVEGRVRNLVFPIFALIAGTIAAMMYTGYQALVANGQSFSVLGAFENTTVGVSLVIGAITALVVLTLCILVDRKVNMKDYVKSWGAGTKAMSGAILILFAAWTINGIVSDMQTGKYLSSLVAGNIDPAFLPAILFVLATCMAFSTGTSWGTFGIMLPIAATMAMHADPMLFLPCLSAVMAGAICGDHCSPISDTTILSSTGAQCNHMDHVNSQLPYAMIVAFSSTIGYLVLGFTESGLAGFVTTGAVMLVLILMFKKNVKA